MASVLSCSPREPENKAHPGYVCIPDTSIDGDACRCCSEALVCIGGCQGSCEGTHRVNIYERIGSVDGADVGRVLDAPGCLLLSLDRSWSSPTLLVSA